MMIDVGSYALSATPLYPVPEMRLWVKDERTQPTGSFKVRGAIRWLTSTQGDRAIVTASSGNHARALLWALNATDDPRKLIVVVSDAADPVKVAALQQGGCDVRICPGDNGRRDRRARELAADIGGTYCSSHDDAFVIDGQAGVVEEVLAQRPDVRRIYVPVGGGGLLAGSLRAAQEHSGVEIIGVQPAGAAAMHHSLRAGRRQSVGNVETICDGLRAVTPGLLCYDIAREHRARVMVIDDDRVQLARAHLSALIGPVEPSAAVSVAGALLMSDAGAVCAVTGGVPPGHRQDDLTDDAPSLALG